ncbi:ATPase AAA [Streptomyces viridochromogenes]|uniref:ATPase AAA n=1 Tax=Streptomyces viridochromogenes TaxID=1938 RepID=A0A0J7ZAG3_STRVR|nr:AAA family ATPase [Streptomyces viridochromogenes]KMS72118.1 ATPase AAA [Streptomyces viridochromogenes]KOG26902.1 ATPase AAA [Streptomyces viridochromogenes]KOG28840.1 ATPase AAA [Streptomyces viridochromogenes]
MYVTEFGLSNVRGFHGSRAVDTLTLPQPGDDGSWTVIAGRNGSGKSTLLRALALALAGPQVARALARDFSGWITTGETAGWCRAAVSPDYSVDQLTGRGRGPDGRMMLGLEWTLPSADGLRHGTFGGSVQPSLSRYGGVTHSAPASDRGPWSDNPQGWFCAAYGPFRRLVGGSGEAQRLMLSPGPAGRMASLFHEDASLAEGVSWLKELRLRSLEGSEEATELLDTVKELLSDGLLPDRYRALRVSSEGLWVAPADAPERAYPLREMSDGFRTVVALVLDLVRQLQTAYGTLDLGTDEDGHPVVRMPGVVIIDEVDAHLHVTWQREIGDWLKSHFPRIQFIVTSHSPYICQAADPGGLIRLPGPEEQRAPEAVAPDLYQRIVYGSGEDAVLSELFGLETPYSERADRLRRLLVRLEEKVFDGEASADEVAEYKELAAKLTSSRTARVYEMAAHLAGDE